MKKLGLILLLIISIATIKAQERKILIIGTETGGQIATFFDINTGEKLKHTILRFSPHISIFCTKDIAIGLIGEYEFVKSNYLEEIAPAYGIGVYARYYLPIKFKKSKFMRERFAFYSELAYLKTNYYFDPTVEGTVAVQEKLSENLIKIAVGTNFRIWKQFHIDLALTPLFFLNRRFRFTPRIGLEYHFKSTKKAL